MRNRLPVRAVVRYAPVVKSRWLLVVSGALCACAKGAAVDPPASDAPNGTGDAPVLVDAADPDPDGPQMRDSSIPTGEPALLLTEMVLTPNGAEYIEILNPNDVPYSLSTFYLSDSGNYFRTPTAPSVDSADFIVKFPGGAQIQPRAAITISLDTAANFQSVYGAPPTYSIAGGTGTMEVVVMSGTPSLTNTGEPVVLFQWDGTADLVKDVDIMIVGMPSATNGLVDKSGVAQDGPDGGTLTSTYKADARTIPTQTSAPGTARSTKRIALEGGNELQTGAGNGVNGDDETSENTAVTWDSAFTAPTPGAVPAALLP